MSPKLQTTLHHPEAHFLLRGAQKFKEKKKKTKKPVMHLNLSSECAASNTHMGARRVRFPRDRCLAGMYYAQTFSKTE